MVISKSHSSVQVGHTTKIGVAIPAYNRVERTRECLSALRNSRCRAELFVVLVDDGSADGTGETVETEFPEVTVLRGDGSLWWTGATNLAVAECLEHSCDYVLLLNQDCIVWSDAVEHLLEHSLECPQTICAAITVDLDTPDRVLGAGARWRPMRRLPWVFQAESVTLADIAVADLPREPLACDMTGGRGVLIPRSAFEKFGMFDARSLPHYGADNDFCLRASRAGYHIHVVTSALVGTRSGDSAHKTGREQRSFIRRALVLLFSRRHGAAASVYWTLARRHTPAWAVLPTYCRMLTLTLKRAWVESHSFTSALPNAYESIHKPIS